MKSSESKISKKERECIQETIAVGAVKYSLLRVSLGKDIIFDVDTSLSLEGESGPYLQYAYARCKSILRKAKRVQKKLGPKKLELDLSREEMDILRMICRFPEIVGEAAEKFSPNLISNFATTIAQLYSTFYNTHPVLKAKTTESKNFRILLTACVAQVLQKSLSLLGIKSLERM